MPLRHFLTLSDLTSQELTEVVAHAIALKKELREGIANNRFHNRVLGMIFEKNSTRTRVSFEAGMAQLGGHAIFLSSRDTQLGRGEPVEDAARVLSRMVDMIMIRTFSHSEVERFAAFSQVPVINGLTDEYHPCQLLADLQTYVEHRGDPKGKTVAWIGDGNNMCQSYIHAAERWDFQLKIACPKGFEPGEELLEAHADRVSLFQSPKEAAEGADWISTDVWASMGQEREQKLRRDRFRGFEVNHELFALANPKAVFMHCLPAHRGEEVSAELLEDKEISIVWDQAENRLHSQKALMLFLARQLSL